METSSRQSGSGRDRQPGDIVFGITFLVLCLFLALNLSDQTTWVTGTSLLAQPAFWPCCAVILMLLFAALHLLSGLPSLAHNEAWIEVWLWIRGAEFAAWFLVYVVAVPRLGYLPSTTIFTTLLAFRAGYRHARYLWLAALFGIVVVVLFKSILRVKIPGGQLYELLPGAMRAFMLTWL